MSDAHLLLTGERTVPGVPAENYWFRRHEVAYAWVGDRVAGERVVDVGCGAGYGTAMLAATARTVLGLDYDHHAVAWAAAAHPPVPFAAGNLAALPLRSAAADSVVAMQLIEHVWDHAEFLAECRRVLHRGGRLVVSTPNRLTFSPGRAQPRNAFHTVEFTADELCGLLAAHGFAELDLLGVYAGSRLRRLDAVHGGSFVEAQLAEPPSRWSAGLVADVASVGRADFELRAPVGADIDESLDLLVLARR